MAFINAWSQFDFRTFNLNQQLQASETAEVLRDLDIVLNGRVYDSALVLSYANDTTLEFYGSGITRNDQQQIVGGQVGGVYAWVKDPVEGTWEWSIGIDRIDIPAVQLVSAQASESLEDDAVLLRQMLSGADRFILSNDSDWARGFTGDDSMKGWDGNDTLRGNGGDDSLAGNDGRDWLRGGSGNDELSGSYDKDRDRFVFDDSDGVDVISRFEDGIDRIVIARGADAFDDLVIDVASGMSVIRFGKTTVYVDVAPDDLTAADFLFHAV